MFTNIQNKILDENRDYVEVMAKSLWDANQIADYDPMHPQWESFEDPIKESYKLAASLAVLANNEEPVDLWNIARLNKGESNG
ncbi:hypothetical protein NVP1278O_11 [Vibrio phage 1.278.O._10N.286.54.E8]|nr:hypothetical protein NVP1278O_11 [Vibrio phage 1.278.O._10N.286.54.E8]